MLPQSQSWHTRTAAETAAALQSSEFGLTGAEAAARLAAHGPNLIQRQSTESPWQILWRQVNNPLVYVLIGSGALALLMGKGVDGLVVLGVVLLNTLIGFLQEYRAGQAIEALSAMVPDRATVIRGGAEVSVAAAEIVPGDLVLLRSGDKVPADLRLITVRSLMVNESALTGESVPVAKETGVVAAEASVAEQHNLCFGGTLVTWGTATGLAVSTGSQTELGRISALIAEAGSLETPLTRSLHQVGKWLTIAILAVSMLLFGVGVLRGYPLVDALFAAITLAVAAIPEGLPAIITIALAIGVQRMAKRNAVIRHLPAVETLGSTTVICSDKTGTLTRNEMTVRSLWTPSAAYALEGSGYAPHGALLQDGLPLESPSGDLATLLRAGALCSDASLELQGGRWVLNGDPTEGALVVAAEKAGLQVWAERDRFPRIDVIPFESERQYMATLHRLPDGSAMAYVKGSPEAILQFCNPASFSVEEVTAAVERMAALGMRVLALACRPLAKSDLQEIDLASGLTFLGLQGMIDPPRAEAVEAIAACHRAGITVKMITGDHATTAGAIGQHLGIMQAGTRALVGADLARMSEQELQGAVRSTNVFARVAPEQKLRLVQALQQQGEVVAMTGDGVNDGPALKQADIGVAMGITGTGVAKEAAAMVLADDNFASIRAAVEEGRRVYDNLVKSLAFVLPTNIGEALIILAAVLFFPLVNGTPLMPILPVQILWINLVATVSLALPLAFEAMEPDVMRRRPRHRSEPLMSRFVVVRTVTVALLMAAGAIAAFLFKYQSGLTAGIDQALAIREAQTLAVTVVILMQVFYLFSCRSLKDSFWQVGLFSNPWIYGGIGFLLLLQLGFVHLPAMNLLFGSAPLSLTDWLLAAAIGFTVIPLISLEKRLRGRRNGDG